MLTLEEMQRLSETISLQEVVAKCKENKEIHETMEAQRARGIFDADENNIFGTGYLQEQYGTKPLGKDDANKIYAKITTTPLKTLLKEFLAKSSTTGIAGAAYLIPVKIRQIVAEFAHTRDIIEDISMTVLGPDEMAGSGATHQIDIAARGSYKPRPGSTGAKKPEEEIKYVKATLDFTAPFYINFNIGNDLIEDSQFNMIEQHVRMAGAEMGAYSTAKCLAVMYVSTDGDGTLNTEAADNSFTIAADVAGAYNSNLTDQYVSDSLCCSYAVILDKIVQDTTYMVSGSGGEIRNLYLKGQDGGLFGLKWVRCEAQDSLQLYNATGDIYYSYVFAKDYAWLSARKRWLRMEKYSDPVRDLTGAVISCRQDTVSVYNDAACLISET